MPWKPTPPNWREYDPRELFFPTPEGYIGVVGAYNDGDETIVLETGQEVYFQVKSHAKEFTVEVKRSLKT